MLGNAIGFLERPKIGGLSSLPDEPGNPGQLDPLSESDWNGVVASSHKHGVAPLLYHRLTSSSSAPQLPENTAQALREAYLMNGARNTLLFQDLAKLLEALRQENIPVIVLKGANLAELVYGDRALRQMGDIDLLVGKAHLSRTSDRLRAMGYVCEDHDIEKCCLINNHLPRYFKPPNPGVEIHWTILMPTRSFRPDLDGLWSRARPATIAGNSALILSPADLLLHLCIHAGSQSMCAFSLGLRPLCDIAVVIEKYQGEIDWKEVGVRAREWQAGRCVFLALLLAKKLAGAGVPEDFLRSLRPEDFDEGWLGMAQSIVLAGDMDLVARPMKVLVDLCAANSFRDKTKNLLRGAFPSREFMAGYMAKHYSLPLTPIRNYTCYWTRGVDLIGKAFRLARHWGNRTRETSFHAHNLRRSAFLQKWLDNNNT